MALPAPSTIAAFKAALHAALTARPGLADVQVSYGSPLPNPKDAFLWLADVEGEQEAVTLGNTRRRERQRLTIIASVRRTSRDRQAVTERAFELVAEVEDALRDDPTLDAHYVGDGQLIAAQMTGPMSLAEFVTSDGLTSVSEVVATISWESRI